MDCDNFTKTKKVGKCGTRIWLGTATTVGTEALFVKYSTNGDEIIEMTTPIIEGNDVFLSLNDPYIDFYNPFNTYFIWLSDASGYYSDGIQITNNGTLHNGFIVNFANVSNNNDRLIIC